MDIIMAEPVVDLKKESVVVQKEYAHTPIKSYQVWNVVNDKNSSGFMSLVVVAYDTMSQVATCLKLYDLSLNRSCGNVEINIIGSKLPIGIVSINRMCWVPYNNLDHKVGDLTDKCADEIVGKLATLFRVTPSDKNTISTLKKELKELNGVVNEYETSAIKLKNDLHYKQSANTRLKNENDKLRKELKEYKEMQELYDQELENTVEEDQLRNQVQKLKASLQEADEEIEELKNCLETDKGEIEKLKIELSEKEESSNTVISDDGKSEKNLAKANAEIARLKSRLRESGKTSHKLNAQIINLNKKLKKAEAKPELSVIDASKISAVTDEKLIEENKILRSQVELLKQIIGERLSSPM